MDYHYSKKNKIVFGISVLGLLMPSALSVFVLSDSSETTCVPTTNNDNAVAYINDTYFLTVSDAIICAYGNDTEDTIYVIPGDVDEEYTQSYIDRDCTLESGDTLIIPYQEETYEDEDRAETNDDFADCNTGEYDYYLTSEVIISNGVTFTNEGTIYIGGMLGTSTNNSRQRPTGHVVNKYTQISMEYNSSIINKGSIWSYGYIKERLEDTNSSIQEETYEVPYIQNQDDSTFFTPFVIYDFKGGVFTYWAYSTTSEDLPRNLAFSIFDIPNIQTLLYFYDDSKMIGLASLYANGELSQIEINVLGPTDDYLFVLEEGHLSFKYESPILVNRTENGNEYTYSYAYNDFHSNRSEDNDDLAYTSIVVYQDSKLNIGHFSFTLSFNVEFLGINWPISVNIDTANIFVPFSYKFNINLKDGVEVSIANKVKFLSGSTLSIEENATLNINADTVAYLNYIDTSTITGSYYPKNLGPAKIINNGSLNINAPFGGFIQTNGSSGEITTTENFENTITLREDKYIDLDDDYVITHTYDIITIPAIGKITNDETLSSYLGKYIYFNNGSYTAKNSDFWYTNDASIVEYGDNLSESIDNQDVTTTTNMMECVLKDTLIYTTNGSKPVQDLQLGDKILAFDFSQGKYVDQNIVYFKKIKPHKIIVVKIIFDDDSFLETCDGQGYFNLKTRKYFVINHYEEEYIGIEVLGYKDGKICRKKITNIEIYEKYEEVYEIVTAYNYNFVANGVLTVEPLLGKVNIFKINENLIYDQASMIEDISKYGLYDYEDVKDFCSLNQFNLYNVKFLKIAVDKGETTLEDIKQTVLKYVKYSVK